MMFDTFDLVIIGAGPAGMSAALRARQAGLSVLVADDQPAPGGQIFRAIEARAEQLKAAEDRGGLALVQAFRACGADYRARTKVWQIEEGRNVFLSHPEHGPEMVVARSVLIATGAQERPVPFPGWSLPGVTTLGAAQIMLKSAGQIPDAPVWIAGSGPLVLLYAVQLLEAGGQIAGILDTSPHDAPKRPELRAAIRALPDLLRGLGWLKRLRHVPVLRQVTGLAAKAGADGALAELIFRSGGAAAQTKAARHLLVHEGLIPRWTIPQALGCRMVWDDTALAFRPAIDDWSMTSLAGFFCAGDGAGIAGAAAAQVQGQIAALGVLRHLQKLPETALQAERQALQSRYDRLTALRPFLDRRYAPPSRQLADDTLVCRCENLCAGDVRAAVRLGASGPNQVKSYTRAGMGPCQGRQCAYSVAALVAEETGRSMADCGIYRVRAPFQPITLGELALLHGKVTR